MTLSNNNRQNIKDLLLYLVRNSIYISNADAYVIKSVVAQAVKTKKKKRLLKKRNLIGRFKLKIYFY